MRPVKVLLVSSHPVQYAAPLFRLYATDSRLDITVAYCCLQGAEPGIDPEFGVEVGWDIPLLDGYRWVYLPNWSLRPGLRGFFGLLNPGLWKFVQCGGFELVVCYGYRTASFWIAALAAKFFGAALVFSTDAHTLSPRDRARWKVPFKRALLPRIFGLADATFGPSSRTIAFLRDLRLPEDRCFLTHYVVDNDLFARLAAAIDRGEVRRRWAIPDGAIVALFVGKLVPWKRPGDLLEAAARVPDLHVVFAGEGSVRKNLESRAEAPDLTGRVRFLGFVNQRGLPEVYAGADVLVLPSEHEPFGLVVNEAFSCGVPAIVSDACGAAGDLVRDEETGYVVGVGEVAALAERLSRFVHDPQLRRTMGENARTKIAEWGLQQNAEAFTRACVKIVHLRHTAFQRPTISKDDADLDWRTQTPGRREGK
jgi:glycosyltransferase involved in cell wall biosynthesis